MKTLVARVTFNERRNPETFEYLKMIAEKELNRSPYLTVEFVEEEQFENLEKPE